MTGKKKLVFGMVAVAAGGYALYSVFGQQSLLAALLVLNFDNWNARTKVIDLSLLKESHDD